MLTKNQKKNICEKYGIADGDTGSYEIQIAIFDAEIKHMKQNPNDKYAKRGFLKVMKKRKDLLRYLKAKNPERYEAVLKLVE